MAHGRYLRRHGGRGLVDALVALATHDPASVPAEVVDAHAAFERQHGDRSWLARSLCQATRSLFAQMSLRGRWFRLERSVEAPTRLLHGADDTVIPLATAKAAAARHPAWTLDVLSGVGHAAPIEAPQAVARAVLDERLSVGPIIRAEERGAP